MKLVTREELADLKATYLAWTAFQREDEDCAQDWRDPETDPYYRLICTLEIYMAKVKLSANPEVAAKQADFAAAAASIGFKSVNWTALIAWAEKWVPDLFWPALLDVLAGNWAALFALAVAQGPQCVTELLAALGVTAPPVVTP